MRRDQLRKIVFLGTTGSGKTTFLRNLVGEFDGAEVYRNVSVEKSQLENTYTPLDNQDQSTTTVSMNVKNVIFLTSKTNRFHFFPAEEKNPPIDPQQMDCVYPTVLIDPAGQERFSFIQDIAINGAHGVIIFADGSNVQSIERISHYYEMVKKEEKKMNKKIPVVVFVNKKDLENKGVYVGSKAVIRWIPDLKLDIHETTNLDVETFLIPIRNFLNKIEGFPLTIDQISNSK